MKHIVVDLEMNTISKKDPARKICRSEIIEIGAVMLDESLQEVSAFRTYVKPQHNDEIASNISRLTGITTTMVSSAPSFAEAFKMFTNWCLGTGEDILLYAWSTSDYEQVCKEIDLKAYEPSESERIITDFEWHDFQNEFDVDMGFEHQISLANALDMAGIEFAGHEHDALDDARNTAILLRVYKDENLFKETLMKIKEAMTPSSMECTLGSMFDFSALLTA